MRRTGERGRPRRSQRHIGVPGGTRLLPQQVHLGGPGPALPGGRHKPTTVALEYRAEK